MMRDVAQWVMSDLGTETGSGRVVELVGPFVDRASIPALMTLCNWTRKIEAVAGIVNPVASTVECVRSRTSVPFDPVRSDPGASYIEERSYDVSTSPPLVAAPPDPLNTKRLHEVEGTRVDEAFLGSCAGGSIEDFRAAATVLRGRRVHPHVRMIASPGSQETGRQASAEGLLDDLTDAGVLVTGSTCGACFDGAGVLADGEVCISHLDRELRRPHGQRACIGLPRQPADGCCVGSGGPHRRRGDHDRRAVRGSARMSSTWHSGRVWRFGDSVGIESISPLRYVLSPRGRGGACLASVDPEFAAEEKNGDLIVAGTMFGIGPGHDHAVLAIKESGVFGVVASSFAPQFLPHAVGHGRPVARVAPGLAEEMSGTSLEVDFRGGRAEDPVTGQTWDLPVPGGPAREIIDAGGLVPYLRARLGAPREGEQ
jgi:3-isopropylmalate dehydratase small subunit